MTKQELIAVLEASDVWTKDRYGHFKLTFGTGQYRLKIQPLVVRYEKKIESEWFCKSGDYYKAVAIRDGFLRIGARLVPITSATMPKLPAV